MPRRLPSPFGSDPLLPLPKSGDGNGGRLRALEWAQSKLEARGYKFPRGTGSLSLSPCGYVVGGTAEAPWGREAVCIALPPGCRPVRNAEVWHAAHQSGLSLDECDAAGVSGRRARKIEGVSEDFSCAQSLATV